MIAIFYFVMAKSEKQITIVVCWLIS